jgi:riboflavin kinase/FMN adenylyltransferase
MNWSGDLYGDVVRVRFLSRLREEKKFSSVYELKAQIDRDVSRAQNYFERAGVKKELAVL